MAIESHIEDPASSPIFSEYPRIMKDNKLMEFITDYLRIMISGNMSSFEIETLMDEKSKPTATSAKSPPMHCNRWPTACRPSASWRRCWA